MSMEEMRLDLSVNSVGEALTDIEKMAAALDRAADASERTEKAVRALGRSRPSGGGTPAARAAERLEGKAKQEEGKAQVSEERANRKPRSRAQADEERAKEQFYKKVDQGWRQSQRSADKAFRDAEKEWAAFSGEVMKPLDSAAKIAAKPGAQPGSFGSRLLQLLGTTRVNVGPLSPLVNRIGALAGEDLGAGGAAGALTGTAIVGGIGALATAAYAAAKGLQEAARRANEFGTAALTTGGTAGQVAGLAAVGVAPNQQEGLAAQLRGRISFENRDPFAMMAASRLGIAPTLGRALGPQNEAQILEKALDGLHKMGKGEEQLRTARLLGLDSTLDLVNVSNDLWRRMKDDKEAMAGIFDEKTTQEARDFQGEMTRLQNSWEMLQMRLAKPVLPTAIKGLDNAAETVRGLGAGGRWWELLGAPGFILSGLRQGWEGAANGSGASSPTGASDPQAQALDRNTDALLMVARAYQLTGNVGERGARALPTYLRGPALNDAYVSGALARGAPFI